VKEAQGWAKNTELDKSLLIISVEGASKPENKSGKFNVRKVTYVSMAQPQSFYRFILLPSFVGLACCACAPAPLASNQETRLNKDLESLSGSLEPDFAKDDALKAESPPTDKAPLAASSAYRDGINLASSAYSLSQSAVSPDDWSLIASRWQQASEQLKQVTVKDKNYTTAQQKVAEYARNASHATAQLQALQQPATAPIRPSRVVLTAANLPPKTAAPVETAVNHSDRPQTIQVPVVRRLHGTPVVQVLFNGDRSYEMILDTGASRTLITRQMADELGIVATERMLAATASENEVTFDLGQVRSMSVGEVTLQNASVTIGDSINIGLLGNDFLQGYDVTIREETVELAISE
jgi:predicted aspartyl protease